MTRLHVISGKGGTGKSTVAAALAWGLARTGARVLWCEVEGRQQIAEIVGTDPLPYAETLLAEPGSGQVYGLPIDPEASLADYLARFAGGGRTGRMLDRVGLLEFATSVAPGVRDVLLTGKVYEVQSRTEGRRYDAVVLDAPPTGRLSRFLNATGEVSGLAAAGPIHAQATRVARALRSPESRVHLVTLAEELPVTETVEAIAELREIGLPVGAVVANQLLDPAHETAESEEAGELSAAELREPIAALGLPADETTLAELAEVATRVDAVRRRQREDLAPLAGAEDSPPLPPLLRLPRLVGPIDHDALALLGDLLLEQRITAVAAS